MSKREPVFKVNDIVTRKRDGTLFAGWIGVVTEVIEDEISVRYGGHSWSNKSNANNFVLESRQVDSFCFESQTERDIWQDEMMLRQKRFDGKSISTLTLDVCYTLAVVFVLLLLFSRQEPQVPRVGPNGPSREQLQQWFDEHPTQAPPAEWYPNGDPWRGITAEEANAMLEDCEVKK